MNEEQPSISRELRERFAQASPIGQGQAVADMLGFVSSMAAETITADIETMLEKCKLKELEGYIFALTRITKHDLAWQCISRAFSNKNQSIPQRYLKQFNQKPEKKIHRMEAQ